MSKSVNPNWTGDSLKAYNRAWYLAHADKAKTYAKEQRKQVRDWYTEYKSSLVCTRCPEKHPACLEFHHLDPKQKDFAIGAMVGKGWGIERIKAEIEKCIVLCNNCHRKLHWENNDAI